MSHNRALAEWHPSRLTRWVFLISLILLTWGLRLVLLEAAPPGWRDDELINIYTLSDKLFEGRFPWYFTGASGHEPLYHNLHAGLHALAGYNILSGHLLSVFFGTLSVVLMYVLVHRLFGFLTAAFTALALTMSFWSLMYSRIALRHISLLPFALAVFYFLWVPLSSNLGTAQRKKSGLWHADSLRSALPLGLALGLSLYTYPAARLLPILLIIFAGYLALQHRVLFRRIWKGYTLALVLTAVLALPLTLAIVQGFSEAAAHGIGADARLVELAQPIRALKAGDPAPLLETTWTTLNMFHATGDPEALYNIPGRSVFNLVGAVLFWAGVLLCVVRWRKARHFFLLLWLAIGLLPTVLSVPPASLSHSILVQPLAYLLPVLSLTEGYRWLLDKFGHRLNVPAWLPLAVVISVLLLIPNAYRDLRDYFFKWPQDSYVRFLYRGDYRDAARYLDSQSKTEDWAVGSLLMGPWDRLAVEADTRRRDLTMRFFDPQRALVYPGDGSPGSMLVTSYPVPSPTLQRLLGESSQTVTTPSGSSLSHYLVEPPDVFDQEQPIARFAIGLNLIKAAWDSGPPLADEQEGTLVTSWSVAEPLRLSPASIVANPPPPGVYSGPRLAVFVHILASDGTLIAGDDGLWVDPHSVRPGDRFVQINRFVLPADAPAGPYMLEIGLYDPFTEERWIAWSGVKEKESDRLILPFSEVPVVP